MAGITRVFRTLGIMEQGATASNVRRRCYLQYQLTILVGDLQFLYLPDEHSECKHSNLLREFSKNQGPKPQSVALL